MLGVYANFTVSISERGFVTHVEPSRGMGLEPFGRHFTFWGLL